MATRRRRGDRLGRHQTRWHPRFPLQHRSFVPARLRFHRTRYLAKAAAFEKARRSCRCHECRDMSSQMQPDNSDLPTERTLTLGRKLGLIAPGVLAFLLGSIELGSRSIWIDESASIAIASQHGAALSSAIA